MYVFSDWILDGALALAGVGLNSDQLESMLNMLRAVSPMVTPIVRILEDSPILDTLVNLLDEKGSLASLLTRVVTTDSSGLGSLGGSLLKA